MLLAQGKVTLQLHLVLLSQRGFLFILIQAPISAVKCQGGPYFYSAFLLRGFYSVILREQSIMEVYCVLQEQSYLSKRFKFENVF